MQIILGIGLFLSLIVAHILGDYAFQILFQCILRKLRIKYTKIGWFNWQMWVHCGLYIVPFIPIFLLFKISWSWLLFLFCSHFIIDNYVEEIKKTNGDRRKSYFEKLKSLDMGLLFDQSMHLFVLTIVFVFYCFGK